MIAFFSGVGSHTSQTASQTETAKSSSVPVKLSGEYWYTISEPFMPSASSRTSRAPLTAMSAMPSRSRPNTTRRCTVEVEL